MTVTVGANSYVDETQLEAYAALRGHTLVQDPSVLLIKAMDVIEPMSWQGEKTDSAQPLQWPRTGVYIDGILIDSSVVPTDIESSQMAQAIVIDQGFNPNSTIGRATKKKKLGTMEIEYMDNASNTSYSPWVNGILQPYLDGSSSFFNMEVSHA